MKNNSISRLWFVGIFFSVMGVLIFAWMIRLQSSDIAQEMLKIAKDYTYYQKTITPERGNIYDRWGHLMAGNTEVYELGADLNKVTDPNNIALTVSSLFGVDYKSIHDLVGIQWEKDRPGYTPLLNSVSLEKIQQIEALQKQLAQQRSMVPDNQQKSMPNLDGLRWTPYLQRTYPEHTLGSNIIGFYNYLDREHSVGAYGVEGKYNHLLAGTPMQVLIPNDPYEIKELPSVAPGISLVLTIDREIQGMAEDVLDRAIETHGAVSGTIVIADPRNGEILAAATTPRLDPNKYWEIGDIFPPAGGFNSAIDKTYEPGSVFKVLTMAAGIDSGAITPTTSFLDTGTIVVGGLPIHNWNNGAWGPQDMTGCMQHSLNVCMAWIATEMGPSQFYNYMQRFGIGHTTGVDLSGEANWPLAVQGDPLWYPINLGTNSFGQGVAVTPIQMVMAISAVANEGKMMSPHVLKAVIENGEQFNNPPQTVGNPISAQTAHAVNEMLAVSLEQEASIALVDGYRVSGKTGTAEIPGPGGYLSDATNASFVGWGPTDSPRFLVYVWLEKPTSSIWGSEVAAPVFSEVVSKLVILLDLPPDAIRQQLINQ